jgi:hypothetical protein
MIADPIHTLGGHGPPLRGAPSNELPRQGIGVLLFVGSFGRREVEAPWIQRHFLASYSGEMFTR